MSETETVLQEIFAEMPGHLNAEAAEGVDCVIQHALEADDDGGYGGGNYFVTIKDGDCQVSEGVHESPSMTMTMKGKDFIALTHGELDGMAAFMGGKLRIAGDMSLAMKMQSFFS